MAVKDWLGPMRGPFLLLTPACMALAIVLAWLSTDHAGSAWGWHALLALVGALSAHVSVNALNEYVDFRSGLDQQTQRTPFSGGSGTLPAQPALASTALWTGLISLSVTGAIGVFFLASWPGSAIELAPLGLLGLLLIVAYTPWVTRRRGVQGVVCGHIHHAEMRTIDGILYCNDGDWVESLTALIEHPDGTLSIYESAGHPGQTHGHQNGREQADADIHAHGGQQCGDVIHVAAHALPTGPGQGQA